MAGQEQDSLGGGFHRDQSFSGEITELNFWGQVLDDYTIMQVSLSSAPCNHHLMEI